ncbi:S9 family peptidase [Chitinophaga sp. HK235]|uniref:alpha/beta hydrolase family protein n=1 Tax=Chitinophaga sp. HK235 TaxID=2952571 RepID=UPI001BA9BD2D|nr:alpha/beta hydrolase [Chitinophaga sp. HK235]
MKTYYLPLLAAFLSSWLPSGRAQAQEADSLSFCKSGAYAMSDGSQLIISPSYLPDLRYRRTDGTCGRLFRQPDSSYQSGPGWANPKNPDVFARFGNCADGTITLREKDKTTTGKRISFPVIPLHVTSREVTLYGELHLPPNNKPRAVLVLHFGSGGESAVYYNYLQHLLPLSDIAVLVYDKRGTGKSTGRLSANFELLAADMAEVVKAVRQLPAVKGLPVGLMGESQGGWIVPLTASLTKTDFLIASYSLLIPPREENRQEVLHDLHQQHYSKEEIAQAMEVVKATDQVARTKFAGGLEQLAALKARYSQEKWYKDLKGDYTGIILNSSKKQLDSIKTIFPVDIPLDYDPLPAFRKVNVPMLWVVAGQDTEAPNEATIAALKKDLVQRKNIDLVIFPHADHGIIEMKDTPEGPVALGRQSPGYFDLLKDWILTREIRKQYGEALQFTHSSKH